MTTETNSGLKCHFCAAPIAVPEFDVAVPAVCSDCVPKLYGSTGSPTSEVVERIAAMRAYRGHVYDVKGDGVDTLFEEAATLLQSLEARIEEKDVALAKCRDKFAEYASQHEAKARAANPGGSSRSMNTEAAERWAKAKRNQEMADLCSAALTPSNRDRM